MINAKVYIVSWAYVDAPNEQTIDKVFYSMDDAEDYIKEVWDEMIGIKEYFLEAKEIV
jgi:hypothetical protein